MIETRHGHPAVLAANDLSAIIALWPALEAKVARGGSAGGGEMVTGSKHPPLPIDLDVVDVITEIEAWVWFCVRVIIEEVPAQHGCEDGACHKADPPVLVEDCPRRIDPITETGILGAMRQLASRIGHFTEHADGMLALAFTDDVARLRHLAESTVSPSGRRVLHIGARCFEHETTDLGERRPCRGGYTVLADPDKPYVIPDLICDRDKTHRIEPVEWQRAYRRKGDAQQAVDLIARWHEERVEA